MAMPAIGQAKMLADEFDKLLRSYSPKSVAVIGCAGANGFPAWAGLVPLRLEAKAPIRDTASSSNTCA